MRLVGTFFVGSLSFVAIAVAVAWISSTSLPTPADAARANPEPRPAPAAPVVTAKVEEGPAPAPLFTVTDIRNFYASGALPQPDGWLFDPAIMPIRPVALAEVPLPAPTEEPSVETVNAVPLPTSNPLFAARVAPGDEADEQLTLAPRPPVRQPPFDVASLPPPPEEDLSEEPAATPKPAQPDAASPDSSNQLRLPTPADKFAVYDIKAKKLYLPNGKKLEAHSGYGPKMDDIRYVHVRMHGVTPPNRYSLRMREKLFHGTEAVRMTPIGDGEMYGRNGFLLHPYLLGPRGDSNGCISLADYDAFLKSFKRGEITEVVVVESMPNSKKPLSPLISWLTGKRD